SSSRTERDDLSARQPPSASARFHGPERFGMIFLLIAGLAVLLAVLRVQTMRVGEPAVIRSALVRGGLAYLAFWIVGTGILGPAGPLAIPGVASRILLDLGWILS